MKTILYKIYRCVLRIVNAFLWNCDCFRLRSSIASSKKKQFNFSKKMMILAPHADDELVGCSTILKDGGDVVVINMDMQGGDNQELHKERYYELKKTIQKYNVKLINIGNDKLNSLCDIICQENPDYIFLPYFFDWHPEHILTMKLLHKSLNIIDYKGNIAMYQVSLPMISELVTHLIPMNKKQWKDKWLEFEQIYITQINIPFKRFAVNERINGAISGTYAAEVFSCNDANTWNQMFKSYILTNEEILYLNIHRQSIYKVYKFLKLCNTKRK